MSEQVIENNAGQTGTGAQASGAAESIAALTQEIAQLKEQRDAVILAHYYVPPEVQAAADYVGDSFALAKLAVDLPQQTIVLCGVEFMGESAKLLNPDKTVLLPEPAADCPMAHMISKPNIDRVRAEYGDDLAVACYVNSTTEMKAWSDVCVTSSNAVKIVRALPQKNVLFIPDMNLGHYVALQVPEKNVILNDGFCPTHEAIELAEVEAARREHPGALVLAHPECGDWVLREADVVGSTSQIIEAAVASEASEFIVCTVHGVIHELEARTAGTGKRFFFPATTPVCPNMARVTAEKVLACLRDGTGEVGLPDESVIAGSTRALDLMLDYAKS